MVEPEYLTWSPEEKLEFANLRMAVMRCENKITSKRHAVVQQDQYIAELKNSSITNVRKTEIKNASTTNTRRIQESSSRQEACSSKQEASTSSTSTSERKSRDVSRYSREWDRGKHDWEREKRSTIDWDRPRSHKNFQNYKKGDYNRKNSKNYERSSSHDKKSDPRWDNASDKKNEFQHIKHFYENTSKQYKYERAEPHHDVLQYNEKYKKYYPTDSKKHNKYSKDSEFRNKKVNIKIPNTQNSTIWHSDRVNEDKHERTLKWIKSMQAEKIESVQEHKNSSSDEQKSNSSPKRKFATASDKYQDENHRPFPKIYLSPKLILGKSKPATTTTDKNKIMNQKLPERNRQSFTKFDRYNRSEHSSEDDSSSVEQDLDKAKFEGEKYPVETTKDELIYNVLSTEAEINSNLESKKQDYNEKESDSSEKINSNRRSGESKNEKFTKKSFDIQRRVPSLNQVDGRGSIEDEDDPAWNKNYDGIWGSAVQSDIKWKISEDKAEVVCDSHNEKGAKSIKVKNPTVSDDGDGEWSTVEEGEISSDHNLEENKKAVK